MKLKLISRLANINFKFAKRLQDNQQHRAARSGASRQSFLLPFVAPHFSAQLELESPMESQKGSPWFLQLTSHRCLLAALLAALPAHPPAPYCLSELGTRLMKCRLCCSAANAPPAGQALSKRSSNNGNLKLNPPRPLPRLTFRRDSNNATSSALCGFRLGICCLKHCPVPP